jgi:hypothetical protein
MVGAVTAIVTTPSDAAARVTSEAAQVAASLFSIIFNSRDCGVVALDVS